MKPLTIKRRIHIQRGRKQRRKLKDGPAPAKPKAPPEGRTPRVSHLMALAIRFDGLIASGEIADRAELARLGHVTRARITQIMNLLCLAPDIQEQVLFLPKTTEGKDPIREAMLRPITKTLPWDKQRVLWRELMGKQGMPQSGKIAHQNTRTEWTTTQAPSQRYTP